MLSVMAAVALAAAVQDPGQWQDFGAGRDGVRVAVNLDSIETGAQGPEAMFRLRYPRPIARNVTQTDVRGVFECSSRRVRRFLMNELTSTGEIMARSDEGEPMEAVTAAAGTPMGEVLDLVCATATG